MQDVAMRRRLAALVIAAAVALLVVSGAMLFGMGKPAQAQSDPEPPCGQQFCLDKTADSSTAIVGEPFTFIVGEPITFTITQRCPGIEPPRGCIDFNALVDTLPSELTVESVDPAGCTTSGNTVTCPPSRFFTSTQPFTLTIVATPTECGEFTNTASLPTAPNPFTAKVDFTVVRCPPPTKDDCKNGGWRELGFPDQGTCVSAVNRQNRS
jgi:hypothetical protein